MTKKVPLFPILLVNFIGTLGFSIVIPFLVILVTKFGGNAFVYGLIGATYSLFQFIGAPILGKWSDNVGRKKILFLSQLGTLIAWIIFMAALFLPITTLFEVDSASLGTFIITLPLLVLFFARALDGITGGNISVAQAYLSDITSNKDRNANFGKLSISANLGFIIGPALAGILGATVLAELLPVIVAIIISVVALIAIAFYLPESHVVKKKVETSEKREKLKDILKLPRVGFMLVLYFIFFIGFNIFYTAFPIHAIVGLEWTVTYMGIYFSILSLIMVIVQGPVLSRASKKFSDGFLVLIGSFILGTSFLFLLSTDIYLIYVTAILFSLGNGLMWPSFLSLLSRVAGDEHQGAVQGFGTSSGSLASIIGLILGGILYDLIGVITFIGSAGLILLAFILSFRLIQFQKTC